MLIAGLTGGMACGKTFVAQTFRDLGCHVIEADLIGHQVIGPGGEASTQVMTEFGTTDRAELAALVFDNPAALRKLNAIVHPAVRERSSREFRHIREHDPKAVVIYVAAILIETGGYRQMDKVILIACSREQQIERALGRPNATMAGVLARLNQQWPLEKKRPFADYVIDASGAKGETVRQTKMVYEELRRLAS